MSNNRPINPLEEQLKSKAITKQILGNTRSKLKGLALTEADMVECVTGVAVSAAQDTFMNPGSPLTGLIEQEAPRARKSVSQMNPVNFGNWKPAMVIRENASGKESTAWQVRHQQNKNMVFEGSFRHEVVAATAAAILNETNSINDPRLKRLVDLSKKESSLMLEMRQAKKIMESTTDKAKLTIFKNKMDEAKLMLAGVRATLGIK